jgi:hypothetical protein
MDGMTSMALLFGLGPRTEAEYRRNQTAIGAEAIPACDRALADPRLQPAFWLRRAHLLQAKALHLIAAKDYEAALRVLDRSDAAAPTPQSPHFAGSVALGNSALRGLALGLLGRKDESKRALGSIVAARPYSASLRGLANEIELVVEPTIDAYESAITNDARLDPAGLRALFGLHLAFARLDRAAPLHGQIGNEPIDSGRWVIEGSATQQYDRISDRAELAGMMAYILQAQGKADAGATMLGDAHRGLEAAGVKPQPNDKGRISKKAQRDYDARAAAVARGSAELTIWEKAIAFRQAAEKMSWSEFKIRNTSLDQEEIQVPADLINAPRKTAAGDAAEVAATARMIAESLGKAVVNKHTITYLDLAKRLPRPETEGMLPKPGSTFTAGGQGLDVGETSATGEITLSYEDDLATVAMAEEIAMLAAARQAKRAGKDSFLITARLAFERTLESIGPYSSSSLLSGHEVRMRILPVARDAMPPGLESAGWRLIDAADVITKLEPRYVRPKPAQP